MYLKRSNKASILFCLILAISFIAPAISTAQTLTPAQEAQLRQELAQVEAEQKQVEAELSKTQLQGASLARDISILNSKIKSAQLKIKAKNLLIQTLGKDIQSKQDHITSLEARISRGKDTLSQIMRKTNEIGSYSLPEVVLSQNTLSGFFTDIDTFESVQNGLKTTFENIRKDEAETANAKDQLDKRRNTEIDARYAIQQEQKNIEADEAEKKRLLSINKNNEKAYANELANKRARASQIRTQLFALRDAVAIPFGEALKYAQEAYKATGIRPAFLLAIITQESNLGANVGSCFVTDLNTGNGVGKNSGTQYEQVMKAPRDTAPFKELMEKLGRDWSKTPVSCPIGSTTYYRGRGFGGGMGPSQFIPSTWILLTDRIASFFRISNPDPWNPEHAFAASAFYLTDLGAVNNSYSAEIRAACKYYGTGGSSCAYGRQVMAKASSIQTNMIDPLQGL